MNLLIKNGTVLIDGKFKPNLDIYIEDKTINEIDVDIDIEAYKIIDATDCYVIPGLLDMHCFVGEPGFEHKETFESVGLSAAKGGFTSITLNPKTSPVIDNKAIVEFVMAKAKEECKVNVFPYGSMTKKCEEKEMAEIGEMRFSGIVAISDGDLAIQDANIMSKIFKYTRMFDMPVITHCEDRSLSFDSGINEGEMATFLGIKGALRTAEEVMLARNLLLAEYYEIHLHVPHVSTKNSVEMIRLAKEKGISVTAETSPHYFILNEEAVSNYNTFVKVNPPLRNQIDVEAIIEGIQDGTIDVISSDHKPTTIDSKLVEFESASFGISSLETAFPLAYTALVSNNKISLEQLVDKMSKKPASILGLNKGVIKVGVDADLTLIKKEKSKIEGKSFLSKAKYSPFDGYEVDVRIEHTIVGGKKV
jgi:dihydroorotase